MRALIAASEAAPWMKVGGLGDVIGSLPAALRSVGVDVRVVLPAHAGVLGRAPSPSPVLTVAVPHRDGDVEATVFETRLGAVPTYLVAGAPLDPDGPVYSGYAGHDGYRFGFFSRAVSLLAERVSADLLHCHDWHTALAAASSPLPSLLTIHNLPYTGAGAEPGAFGFGYQPTEDDRLAGWLRSTPLGIGLAAATRISTVSEGYAREIQTVEHGHGFEGLLRARGVVGVLNGIDPTSWDPMRDPAIAVPYQASDPGPRAACREALLAELGLPEDARPLVAFVGRLVMQKGIDLAVEAVERLFDSHRFSVVVLGTGDPELEGRVSDLAARHPGRLRAYLAFDEALARRIYAGADLVLLPSRYEPCGVTQMIAMRYGAVPVAVETGGLADTVHDADLADEATGVLVPTPTVDAVRFGLRRAFGLLSRAAVRRTLVEHGMHRDFGWTSSAERYRAIYRDLIGDKRA